MQRRRDSRLASIQNGPCSVRPWGRSGRVGAGPRPHQEDDRHHEHLEDVGYVVAASFWVTGPTGAPRTADTTFEVRRDLDRVVLVSRWLPIAPGVSY